MILDALFFLFAAGAVLGSVLMITRRNPVSSVIFLVLVFFCLSGLFLLLDAHFVAAINVILYAGAIMVLFLFVIMLLNLGHMSWSDMRRPLAQFGYGTVALAFLAVTTWYFFAGDAGPLVGGTPEAMRETLAEKGAIGAVAEPLYRDFVVPFQLTGLLLVSALVGTIVLARRDRP